VVVVDYKGCVGHYSHSPRLVYYRHAYTAPRTSLLVCAWVRMTLRARRACSPGVLWSPGTPSDTDPSPSASASDSCSSHAPAESVKSRACVQCGHNRGCRDRTHNHAVHHHLVDLRVLGMVGEGRCSFLIFLSPVSLSRMHYHTRALANWSQHCAAECPLTTPCTRLSTPGTSALCSRWSTKST
jgi:hypothetical protein